MPRYGFNFLWMVFWAPGRPPRPTDERALDFMAEQGFDFARVPTDYRHWVPDYDYKHPKEAVWEQIDAYLAALRDRGIHMSLNMHRAPGYCINGNDLEKHNLWLDREPQDGFVFAWECFARRYKGVPSAELSFDLLNEPPSIGQYGFTRVRHARIIRRTVAAIRAIDPDREIVIDGLAGGHLAMPELADLAVVHSGRGYQPMAVSHYKAGWWEESAGLPEPVYPGTVWDGRTWDGGALREFYEPWREVERRGVTVHIGEFGCHSQTPNDVALRWFEDLLGVFREFGWGFALWELAGPFGIVGHGRPGAAYEDVSGYRVDRALLELLKGAQAGG